MATQESTVVDITSDEDVERLLGSFPEHEQSNVVITVRPESTALLTASEFFRLFSAARKSGVTLTISTDDPLRCELARMLGWSVGEPPEKIDEADSSQEISGSRFTADDLAAFVRRTPSIPDRPESGSPAEAPTTAIALPEDNPPPATISDPGAPYFQTVTSTPSAIEKTVGRGKAFVRAVAGKFRVPAEQGRKRKYVRIGAIGAPVLVLVLLAGLLYYVLPTATITIVPTEHAIAADLTYGLDAPGATYDIKLAPTPMSNTSVFDKTIPTTGARYEPDGTASGQVVFTNPQTTAVSIPAQSKITGSNGQVYLTKSAVTVPAADPFGSMSFGSAAVGIVAAQAGSGSNADPGYVVGQLGNGLFYTNKDPVGGGTDKKIPTVSQNDIAALTDAAKKDLDGRAEKEFDAKIGAGLKVVPDSLKKSDPALTFTHQANEDATEVAVHATMDVNAQTYDPAKLLDQAHTEASRRLASQAGPDAMLVGSTLQISDPKALNDQQTGFSIHASATVRSVINEAEQSRLASSLVGKNLDTAKNLLHQQRDVANFQMTLSPSWLPQRLPELASRIHINVASKE